MYVALISFLMGILTRITNQPHGKPDTAKSTKEQTTSDSRPVVITYSPPPLTDEEVAQKKKKESREKARFRYEKWGLLVLAVYTGFTGFMWWETRKAANAATSAAEIATQTLKASRKSSWLEQRAWITLSADPNVTFTVERPISITVKIDNIGRTPASKLEGDVRNRCVAARPKVGVY